MAGRLGVFAAKIATRTRVSRRNLPAASQFTSERWYSEASAPTSRGQWKDKAECVVVGGGAVGASVVYHLAKAGVKDVVLLEKSELTAGSTWHAAGLVAYYHGAVNMKRIHHYGVTLCKTLPAETGQEVGFHTPGSIRLAQTPDRMDEFRFQLSRTRVHPAPVAMLDPDQIQKLHPLLNMKNILGGFYNEGDGHVDPYSLTMAYAAGARKYGASVVTGTEVTDTKLREDGKWEVSTPSGTITTKHLVNAAGLWARELGAKAGLDLPIVSNHHQYVVTSTLPEVEALERELPVIRDLEGSYYLRQERQGLLYGPYESVTNMRQEADWYDQGVPKGFAKELFQSDLDRISWNLERAMELVPCLQTASIQSVVSGPITYSPEVTPMAGPYQGLPNYWVAVANTYGIAHSAGIGKLICDWMIDGEPSNEFIDMDPNRFQPTWTSREFLLAKSRETYGMNNHVGWIREERFAGRPTSRVSKIYDTLKDKGAEYGFHAGWEQPNWFALPGDEAGYKPSFHRTNWFEPVGRESQMIRERCGLIDLTPFGKFKVSGPDTVAYLDRLLANHVPKVNTTNISHMITPRGKVYAEVTVTRTGENECLLITGSGSELHDLRWMEEVARKEGFKVTMDNVTDQQAVIGLAGPKSREVMGKLTNEDVSDAAWPFLAARTIQLAGENVLAIRISYTGELGWELVHMPGSTSKLYGALVDAGSSCSIGDFGTYAMGSLRVEKGFRGWGAEMNMDTNPFEAGLGPFIKMNKPCDFVGKSSLQKIKAEPMTRKVAYLTLEETDRVDPQGDEGIWKDGKVVGNTTSGAYGYQVGAPICMAYLPPSLCVDGESVQVELLGKKYSAGVSTRPWVPAEPQRK